MLCTSASYQGLTSAPLQGDVCNINYSDLLGMNQLECPYSAIFVECSVSGRIFVIVGRIQNKQRTSIRCIEFNTSEEFVYHYNPMHPLHFVPSCQEFWFCISSAFELLMSQIKCGIWNIRCGPLCARKETAMFLKRCRHLLRQMLQKSNAVMSSQVSEWVYGGWPGDGFGSNLISSWELYDYHIQMAYFNFS